MTIRQIQSVFTLGELDPKLFSRTDFDGYFKGGRTLRDVVAIPQGGAQRRFGTTHVAAIVDSISNTSITDPTEVKAYQFDFTVEKTFFIVVRPHNLDVTPTVAFDIYLNDVLQQTRSGALLSFAIADIQNMRFASSSNRVLIFVKGKPPAQLIRVSDTSWSLSAIDFTYVPTYDFTSIDGGINYRNVATTFTPAATSGVSINLTCNAAVFNSGHSNGIFVGGGGIFRIRSVNAAGTIATGDTIEDFASTSAIKGLDSLLESSAWGDFTSGTPAGKNRGWPGVATFYQNRLVVANTPDLPNFLFASNINDFFNFDDAEFTDLNAFSYGLSSDILSLVDNKALIALTARGLESTSLFTDLPMTASNVFFTSQSKSGSANFPGVVVDDQLLFVDRNNRQINSSTYEINNASFDVRNISILSPQLINNPTSTATFRPNTENGEMYLVTNEDGTMAVLQSLISQNIQGWTLARTQGAFEQAYGSPGSSHVICRRTVGTETVAEGVAQSMIVSNDSFASFAAFTDGDTAFVNDDDYLIIGHEAPFSVIEIALGTPASASVFPTFEYLSSTASWESFAVTDATTGFTLDAQISWDNDAVMPKWRPMQLSVQQGLVEAPLRKFWIRIRRTEETLTTSPVIDTLRINTTNELYIEAIDFNVNTDATLSTFSDVDGLVTGLEYLAGQQVYAVVDDTPEGPFYVPSDGEITVSGQSQNVIVGINYIPEISPMPLVVQFAYSQSVYQPKHIKSIYIDYYESLGILVNGLELPSLSVGSLVLDAVPVPQSGFHEFTPMRGWNPREANTISQELPLPMTIIGIGYRLEAS